MRYMMIFFLVLVGFTGIATVQAADEVEESRSGMLVATTSNVVYKIPYHITSGTVDEINPVCDTASAIVLFSSEKSGKLTLDIPRNLLDSKYNKMNTGFFVLLDGEEIDFEETRHAHSSEITIFFESGSYDLEIITTWGFSLEQEEFACKVIHNPPYSYILPPLKQAKFGASIDEIKCNEDFVKTIKISNNSPACVKLETKTKLIQRGWAEQSGNIVFQKTSQPEPSPTSTQCRPGLPPFTSNFYLDNELCKWKLIPEPVIDEVIPYVWNAYLQKNQIEFSPQEGSYSNTDEGYFIKKETRVCSPLNTSDGSELYISSTFTIDPFKITDTMTSKIQPDDCHKIWKTGTVLVEPTPELGAWLKNYWEELED